MCGASASGIILVARSLSRNSVKGGSEGIVVVLATRYGRETKPVCLEVAEGETGIPIFDTIEDAEEFAEAYRGLLGPALEALELPDHAMAQLLRKCADKTEHVILKPRPVGVSGDSVWWEMVDLRQFAEGLSESGL
jgi:hypothetical protein